MGASGWEPGNQHSESSSGPMSTQNPYFTRVKSQSGSAKTALLSTGLLSWSYCETEAVLSWSTVSSLIKLWIKGGGH